MADNVTLNAGTGGDTIAADDVGGAKYQRVKLSLGADGTVGDAPVGGGVEAGVLRVTIASDSTGVLSVDDNGGSITVDNGGTFAVQAALTAGTNTNEVVGDVAHDAPAAGNPLLMAGYASAAAPADVSGDADAVRAWHLRNGAAATVITAAGALIGGDATNGLDVDVTRVIPGTSATHLGKAVDAVAGATDTGVAPLFIRDDVLSTLTPADGDYVPGRVSSTGALHVAIASGSIAGIADDAAFTPGTSEVLPVGYTADETATDSVDEGDLGAARMTLDRKQIVTTYAHAGAGGSLPFKNLDVDESEDDVKTSAGKLFWIHVMNLHASSTRYLKIYNATAANVTVGTTTPVHTFAIPANVSGFTIGFGPQGQLFDTAICIAATTGFADNDTGAPGANEVIVNGGYI